MIGTIRKHQAWLWYLIIGVTIVTFVGFLSPNSGRRGNSGSEYDFGSINGEPISRKSFLEARAEERLDFRLRYNQWPSENEEQLRTMGYDLTAKTYQRLFLNAKAAELKIEVSDDAVVRKVKQMFGLQPDQTIPPERYQEFIQRELWQNGVSEADFQRFVRNRVAHEQLIAMYGMSGQLITPKEAESFYKRENEPASVSAAFFPYTNFTAKVQVTPELLQGYYKSNQSFYRIPEKVQVAYVKFENTNYYDKVLKVATNLDQSVSAIYAERGAAAFKDKDGNQMSEADAKATIKKQAIESSELIAARRDASAFITELYQVCNNTNKFSLEKFQDFAQKHGATVKTTEAFDERSGPPMKVTGEFVQAAFTLTETAKNDPEDKSRKSLVYRKALSGDDGAYVIALKQRIPSRVQEFEEVKDKVTKDYTRAQAIELAMAAGEKFGSAVTNGMASGKSFAEICTAQNVKPVDLPPFSLATRVYPDLDRTQFQEMQRVVTETPTGKATGFNPGLEGGFVAYVKERLPVDQEKLKTEMPQFVEQMRANRQLAAFNEWFLKEFNNTVRRPLEKSQG